MAGREFEFLGKRVDLAIDKGTPALDLSSGNAHALEPIDNTMCDARDGLGHQRHGKDAEKNAAVAAKTKDALQNSEKIFLNQAEFKSFSSQKSKAFTKIGKMVNTLFFHIMH